MKRLLFPLNWFLAGPLFRPGHFFARAWLPAVGDGLCFADSPGVLLILGFIPVLGGILSLVVLIWTLVSSFIATRQALDIDNTKTFFTILIGAVALAIVFTVISAIIALIFVAGAAVRG